MRATVAGLLLLPLLLAVFASYAEASIPGDGDPDIPQAWIERGHHPQAPPIATYPVAGETRNVSGPSMGERPQELLAGDRVPISEGFSWTAWLSWLRVWMIR